MNTKPLIWKEGLRSTPVRPRATNITPEEWQTYRDVIYQWYMLQDLSLKRVARYMQHHHQFFASERQYTSQFEKWGWIKRSSHRRGRSTLLPTVSSSSGAAMTGYHVEEEKSQEHEAYSAEVPSRSSSVEAYGTDIDKALVPADDSTSLKTRNDHEQPLSRSKFKLPLQTQNLPTAEAANANKSLSLLTPDSWETENANLSFPESDGESPATTDIGKTSLPNFSNGFAHSPLSQIPIQQLTTGGPYKGTVLLNSVKPKTVKTLENILRNDYSTMLADRISDDDLKELVRTSDFLFAAQSYEDSFTLSRITHLLVEKFCDEERSSSQIGALPIWLKVTINLMRSVTTHKDYKLVVQALKKIRTRAGFNGVKDTKDYNLLQAFLGDVLNELSDHKDSQKAAVACWIKLLAQPSKSVYLLSRHIMSSTILEIISHHTEHNLPLWTYQKLQKRLKDQQAKTDAHSEDKVISNNANQVLRWCVENLSCDEFYFMVSNIDNLYWKADRHDIEIFERLVIYCYLCERLWRLELEHRTNVAKVDRGVIKALNRIQDISGLCKVITLFSLVNMCRDTATSLTESPTRLTLPARYKYCFDTLHDKAATRIFDNDADHIFITAKDLIDHSGWPGKITSLQDQLHSSDYGWSVRIFLREFISVNMELDLTKRLHQAEDKFRDGRVSTDSTAFVPTARSSQISEDYAVFKAAAKRVSHDTMASLHNSVQLPTAGLDELTSDIASQCKLFRYSSSVRGSAEVGREPPLETNERNSRQMSLCAERDNGKEDNGEIVDQSIAGTKLGETDKLPTDAELIQEMNRMSF